MRGRGEAPAASRRGGAWVPAALRTPKLPPLQAAPRFSRARHAAGRARRAATRGGMGVPRHVGGDGVFAAWRLHPACRAHAHSKRAHGRTGLPPEGGGAGGLLSSSGSQAGPLPLCETGRRVVAAAAPWRTVCNLRMRSAWLVGGGGDGCCHLANSPLAGPPPPPVSPPPEPFAWVLEPLLFSPVSTHSFPVSPLVVLAPARLQAPAKTSSPRTPRS